MDTGVIKLSNLHPWQVSPKQAVELQQKLAAKIILKNKFSQIKTIAGCDVAYVLEKNKICAAIVILSFPELKVIEEKYLISDTLFPYIPGLLTFREGPAILNCFKLIQNKPDVVIFDGQGIAHPRKMGIASHLGLFLDLPTIGCAKSVLCGTYRNPSIKKSSYSYLYNHKKEIIGAVLRTKNNTRPVFVSSGHKINLDSSLKIILSCCTSFRLPEPTRLAHQLCNKIKLTLIHK